MLKTLPQLERTVRRAIVLSKQWIWPAMSWSGRVVYGAWIFIRQNLGIPTPSVYWNAKIFKLRRRSDGSYVVEAGTTTRKVSVQLIASQTHRSRVTIYLVFEYVVQILFSISKGNNS